MKTSRRGGVEHFGHRVLGCLYGRARRYTRDFLVRRVYRSELVEVKYLADLDANADRLRPAFDVARAWANENRASLR
jgi:hypothetical protein